jgi:hypothetical protein
VARWRRSSSQRGVVVETSAVHRWSGRIEIPRALPMRLRSDAEVRGYPRSRATSGASDTGARGVSGMVILGT